LSERAANWAGNVVFSARRLHRPASVPDLQRLVGGSTRVRALGTGHSFSPIADTTGDLVSLAGLGNDMTIDAERAMVKVSAGATYRELTRYLHGAGYALRNLGSLPHISVAGACATGTHGGGDANGSLATAVSGMDLVTADGDIVTITRAGDRDEFSGAVVGLGALGIVISLWLDIVPAFDLRQYVYQDLPWDQLERHLPEIFASGYSVSLFSTWRTRRIDQVWLKQRVTGSDPAGAAAPVWFGARLADGPRNPVPGLSAAPCTQQMGIPGPWHQRLPHFRPDHAPSAGQELQSEYLLPREHAVGVLQAIAEVSERVAAFLQVCEIRTIAADDLWLSPSYHRDTVAVHFTWIDDALAVATALALVEDQLAPFLPRPHWGKLFRIGPEVIAGRYDRLPDFRQLMRRYDPAGKFRNQMLDTYIPVRG